MDLELSTNKIVDQPQSTNRVQSSNQNKKTMKLAPTNFPMKALVTKEGFGNVWNISLGDINDENALTIFVEGDYIVNANESDWVLRYGNQNDIPHFCPKNPTDKH